MKGIWPLSAWILKFERAFLSFKLQANCNLDHGGAIYHIFAYTIWYVWQLKFLVLRQYRKLGDEEARNGRISVWNQLLTKAPVCNCVWLKLSILTSPRASRACVKDGLLLLGAWSRKGCFSLTQHSHGETAILRTCWIAFTKLANDTSVSSSAEETFWKKSFQTSTGYVVWPSSEHFIRVPKLSGVRLAALKEKKAET